MKNFSLNSRQAALLVVDVQEKLFPLIDRPVQVMQNLQKMIRGAQVFDLPIFITEQYPQGLGPTIAALKGLFDSEREYYAKTMFSCWKDAHIQQMLANQPVDQWILVGIEAHVCVLQTAKDLQEAGKDVVVLNDAISSRSIYDFSTAIAEMRDMGIRVSSMETVLFELCRDAKNPAFKQISQIIKESCGNSCSSS